MIHQKTDTRRQDLLALKKQLEKECHEFEKTYSMKSEEFYVRFEKGELGDDMDFFEWSSAIDMLKETENDLKIFEESENK